MFLVVNCNCTDGVVVAYPNIITLRSIGRRISVGSGILSHWTPSIFLFHLRFVSMLLLRCWANTNNSSSHLVCLVWNPAKEHYQATNIVAFICICASIAGCCAPTVRRHTICDCCSNVTSSKRGCVANETVLATRKIIRDSLPRNPPYWCPLQCHWRRRDELLWIRRRASRCRCTIARTENTVLYVCSGRLVSVAMLNSQEYSLSMI